MLFFGTPHRGSPKEDVLKMVEHAYPNRVPALLQTTPGSESLMYQLGLFMDIIGDRQIGSFYETEPTPTPAQVSRLNSGAALLVTRLRFLMIFSTT